MFFLVGILLVSAIIFIHEVGHLLAARYFGVRVLSFTFGVGPKVWLGEFSGTHVYLSTIPLGGYLRLLRNSSESFVPPTEGLTSFLFPVAPDEQSALRRTSSLEHEALDSKSLAQQALILLGGVAANFTSIGVAALILAFQVGGRYTPASGVRVGELGGVSAASNAGLLPGDVLLSVNGESLTSWEHFGQRLQESQGKELSFLVQRRIGHENESQFSVGISPVPVRRVLPTGETEVRFALGFTRPFDFEATPVSSRLEDAGLILLSVQQRLFTVLSSLPLALGFGASAPLPRIEHFPGFHGIVGYIMACGTVATSSPSSATWLFIVLSLMAALVCLIPYPGTDGGNLLLGVFLPLLGSKHGSMQNRLVHQIGHSSVSLLVLALLSRDLMDLAQLASGILSNGG